MMLGPNITGTIEAASATGTHAVFTNTTGAFSVGGNKRPTFPASVPATVEVIRNTSVDLNASHSSSIYGNSTTVQPKSLILNYVIKY